MAKESMIEAGRITNTHGVRGEVKIEVWLDSPDFLKRCKSVSLEGKKYRFTSARPQGRFLIAGLDGIGSVEEAALLKGKTVTIERKDAPLGKGEYFLQDILGADVIDETGKQIGKLEEIVETPRTPVYVVRGETEHLIPAVPEFILRTDADAGIVTVRLIEGM
jgi:16S rRNA processing protein RimM